MNISINMQYSDSSQGLSHDKWDICIFGKSVDDRGRQAVDFAKANADISLMISYDPINFVITINEDSVSVDDIGIFFDSYEENITVLIDSTTLDTAEILIIMQSLYSKKIRMLDTLYLEPKIYRIDKKKKIIHKRDFELSSTFKGYIGIPGHTLCLSQSEDKCIFLCGYEAERIDRAIEELNINHKKCQFFFGVPAFHSGWEMNTFSNNIKVIERRSLGKDFYFCGASNPLAVYEKLETIYNGINGDEQLFIVPVGTKPMALGACLFKILHSDSMKLAFLYDHPEKIVGRSREVARWNLFNIKL